MADNVELLRLRAQAKAKAERERSELSQPEVVQDTVVQDTIPQEDPTAYATAYPRMQQFLDADLPTATTITEPPGGFQPIAKAYMMGLGRPEAAAAPLVPATLDVLSMPGRAAAALLFKGDMEGFRSAMARVETQEDTGFLSQLAEGILRDPATLPGIIAGFGGAGIIAKLLSQAPKVGAKVGILATAGGLEGTLGASIHAADQLAQGKEVSAGDAALEIGLGTVLPGSFKAVGTGLKSLGPGARKLASELSGVAEDALKMWGTGIGVGAKKMKAIAGRQKEIGTDLLDALENKFDKFIKPEKDIVNQALIKMPPMNTVKVVNSLKQVISTLDDDLPNESAAKESLESYLKFFQKKKGLISAKDFNDLKKRIDKNIPWDKEGEDISNEALQVARRIMKDELEAGATKTGNEKYVSAMASMHDKLGKRDAMLEAVGKSSKTRAKRIQSFIDNLFGKNKEQQQQIMADLTDIVGEDFLKDSKIAQLASQMGLTKDKLYPSFISKQTTGRSVLGSMAGGGQIGYGAATGNPALIASGVATGAMSSPMLAAPLTSGLEALSSRPGQFFQIPQTGSTLSQISRSGMFGATNNE